MNISIPYQRLTTFIDNWYWLHVWLYYYCWFTVVHS